MASSPGDPSPLVLSPQGRGRSSGGPVDQYIGEGAFGWSAQIDASHILDLATKPDGELVVGGGEFRKRLLDVGSLKPLLCIT